MNTIILAQAGNTQGAALHIIENQKGYTILFDDRDEESPSWIAVKEEKKFIAESAEALLGLICIYETLGETWREYSHSKELLNKIYDRDI